LISETLDAFAECDKNGRAIPEQACHGLAQVAEELGDELEAIEEAYIEDANAGAGAPR